MLTQTTLEYPVAPQQDNHITTVTSIIWKWAQVPGATGYRWGIDKDFSNAIDIGNVLQKSETGLTCGTQYTSYVWAYDNCGHSDPSLLNCSTQATTTPSSGASSAAYTTITWIWNPVSDATGYKWNTTNDYNTAIDIGPGTTKIENGLNCGTSYTRYVWAYGTCGVSNPRALTKATKACCTNFVDSRDNQSYSAVQIGEQCWMAENMNIGIMMPVDINPINNGIIEKYCYDDDSSNCTIYGGIYQWYELMNWNAVPGGQGICPSGWHVPTDEEWCELAFIVDSSVICDSTGSIGTNAGHLLKSTNLWNTGNGIDQFGFGALPSGYRFSMMFFSNFYSGMGTYTNFATSSIFNSMFYFIWGFSDTSNYINHTIEYTLPQYNVGARCHPVRCVR